MRKYILFVLMSFVVITACNDKGDDISPGIDLEFIFPIAVEREVCGVTEPSVFVFADDQEMEVRVMASDNEELGQIKVDIHANFDCHGHGGVGTIGRPPTQNSTTDWRLLDIRDISGADWDETLTLIPPSFATAGPYHLSFQVLDASGNETDPEFFTIYLFNSSDTVSPEIDLTAPASQDLGNVTKGSTINFTGTVTDNLSLLEGGNGIIYLVYLDVSSGNYFQGPYERIQLGDGLSYEFDLIFDVPNTLVSGDYRIFLRASDGVNNISEALEFDMTIP